jgi:hypothetical protein
MEHSYHPVRHVLIHRDTKPMPINGTANSVSDVINLIRQINSQPNEPSEHTITFGSGFPNTAQISNPLTGSDGLLFGPLAFPVILRNIRIIGNGKTFAGQSAAFRFFGINGKRSDSTYARLTLEQLGLSNGNSGSQGGGAILNDGTSNAAGGRSLVIRSCYFNLNTAGLYGGAIYNGDGARTGIFSSIFSNNIASGINARGGAIYNSNGSILVIRDCTFSNNRAPGTGGLGGAIFIFGGQVDAKNSSFIGNEADGSSSPSFSVYRQNGIRDVGWNWWGGVDIFDAPQPALSNLPRFVRPLPFPIYDPGSPSPVYNPSLPYEADCQIVAWNGAPLHHGPSSDDFRISSYPNLPLKVRARATDEFANVWLGFAHPSRIEYLTWVPHAQVTLDDPFCSSSLPNFTTQPNDYFEPDLLITNSPFAVINQNPPTIDQKGFGLVDPLYSNLPGSRHPGFDFFPPPPTANIRVAAVAGGMVVGIGRSNAVSVSPGNWGATQGGFNLIVRTGGYFLLYGHLASIDPSIYLGARFGPGAILGVLWDQGSNTHLHLEVRAFRNDTNASQFSATLPQVEQPIRCRFGAIVTNATANVIPGHPRPRFAIDPMTFIANRGVRSTTSDPSVYKYSGSQLFFNGLPVSFNYRVQGDLDQRSFDLYVNPLVTVMPQNTTRPMYCPQQ